MNILNLYKKSAEAGVFLFVEEEQLRFKLSVDVFPAELKQDILAHKTQLIAFLSESQMQKNQTNRPEIKAYNTDDKAVVCSFSQQRLWFIDQLEGGSAQYNMPGALKVEGHFDLSIAEQAFTRIIGRHEPLRTIFKSTDKGPEPIISDQIKFKIRHLFLNSNSIEVQDESIRDAIREDANTPFILSEDLLLRVSFLETGNEQGVLLFNMHHIASDGWSMGVLIKEFTLQYEAIINGKPDPLAPLSIKYSDYARWQKEWLTGDVLESQLDYWKKQLAELPQLHDLPIDKVRPAVQTFNGECHVFSVNKAILNGLKVIAKNQETTLFTVLHGVFSLLLARHSGSNDIVIGTPVANRMQKELESLVGFFVNTLILRVNCTENVSFTDFITQVKEVNKMAQSHQDVPFEQLVEMLSPVRSSSHAPLFQILFSMDTNETQEQNLAGLKLTPLENDEVFAKFELTLSASESENGLEFSLIYNRDLFSKKSIEAMARRMQTLLQGVVTNSETPVHQLPLLDSNESDYLLQTLNDNKTSFPTGECIHELFELQALKTPTKLAIESGTQQLTYAELNSQANQLAHYLMNQGVEPNVLVGVSLVRTVDLMVTLLAILKAGGAYVPLDPTYPEERLNKIANSSKLKYLVTQENLSSLLDNKMLLRINIDCQTLNHDLNSYPNTALTLGKRPAPSDLAYVIYTSGSTGEPKGVAIEHKNTCAMLHWAQKAYSADELASVLASTSLNFDLSVFELFLPLSVGGKVLLVRDILSILEQRDLKPSLINTVPSGISALLSENAVPESAQVINLAGEPLSADIVNQLLLLPKCNRVANLYGPSEDTTYSTYATFSDAEITEVSIGRPIDNTQSYVLNQVGQPVPEGVVGELYLAGSGVARGYYNQKELTLERFIDNPFCDDLNSRMYRTGDLVCYQPDGQLKFVGRIDDQVKIRGFRIELAEIEYALSQQALIKSAVVMPQNVQSEQTQLVAYVTINSEQEPGEVSALLRESLKATLPDYMVPSYFMVLDDFPLLPNGKVNKKALVAVENITEQKYVAPSTEVEHLITQIWSDLLPIKTQEISAEADFFALGGHSLLSVRLIGEIRNRLGIELSIRDIFDAPQLTQLAKIAESKKNLKSRDKIEKVERNNGRDISCSFAQQRLWFIDQLQSGSSEYNMPVAFEVEGKLDLLLVESVIKEIIQRHEVLRTVYAEGEVGARQDIQKDFTFNLVEHDLTDLTNEEQSNALKSFLNSDVQTKFNLQTDLMIRASYILLADDRAQQKQQGVLLFNMHHIASDGWSMEVLTKEFFTLYLAFSEGKKSPLAPLEIQYADYAQWQRKWLEGEVQKEQLAYWGKQLSELPLLHGLTLNSPRQETKLFDGEKVSAELPKGVMVSLRALAKQYQLTPFMLLHSALALVLSRHSNSNDIVIGSPVANRIQAEIEPLIGFFVNTLVLRLDTQYQYLEDYFAHVRQTHLDAQSNQDVPFEQLVELLNITRSSAHTPLFQIMLTTSTGYGLNSIEEEESFKLPGINLIPLQSELITTKFDLEIDMSMNEQGISMDFIYDTSLFSHEHIEQLKDHLTCLLEGMAEQYEALQGISEIKPELKTLPMLSQGEENYLLNTLNETQEDYPKNKCIHELFEQQAKNTPNATAVVFKDKKLT
ncbi:non-ribosomal peptide synthetase, partial [Pseudoalteromonas denitrificans]